MQVRLWACGRGDVSTPSFDSHLNPIPTRGADYAHHILMSTPSFESHRHACSELAYLIYGDLGLSVRQEFEIVGRGTHGAIDNLLYQI